MPCVIYKFIIIKGYMACVCCSVGTYQYIIYAYYFPLKLFLEWKIKYVYLYHYSQAGP